MILSTKVYRVINFMDRSGISLFKGQIAINSPIIREKLRISRIRANLLAQYIYSSDYILEYIGSEDPINYINQI